MSGQTAWGQWNRPVAHVALLSGTYDQLFMPYNSEVPFNP